ncbi:hypothetical protein N602_24325 [Mycobacterium avium subsp. hominissuis 10-5606]|nr:hypothetical protein N602_24325 [Mycobacterium avium subsp. hominissuis 10-5606]
MVAVAGVLAALVFISAIRTWRTTGRSELFWVTLGATVAVFYEPVGDMLVDIVYHAQTHGLTVVSGFGVSIPLWVLFMYTAFWGPGILWLTKKLEDGITAKQWMGWFVASIPMTWLFEVPMLKLGLYEYYGPQQPFKILEYPWWMCFSNSAVIFIVALLVHVAMKTTAVRNRPAYLVFLTPGFIIGVGLVTVLPVAYGMTSSTSLVVINLTAAISSALSVAYVWVGYKVVNPSPQAQPEEPEKQIVAA